MKAANFAKLVQFVLCALTMQYQGQTVLTVLFLRKSRISSHTLCGTSLTLSAGTFEPVKHNFPYFETQKIKF